MERGVVARTPPMEKGAEKLTWLINTKRGVGQQASAHAVAVAFNAAVALRLATPGAPPTALGVALPVLPAPPTEPRRVPMQEQQREALHLGLDQQLAHLSQRRAVRRLCPQDSGKPRPAQPAEARPPEGHEGREHARELARPDHSGRRPTRPQAAARARVTPGDCL